VASQGLDPSQKGIAELGEARKLHGRELGTDNPRTGSRGTEGQEIGKEQVRAMTWGSSYGPQFELSDTTSPQFVRSIDLVSLSRSPPVIFRFLDFFDHRTVTH